MGASPPSDESDALRREVLALRSRVAELQRAAARHEDTEGISLAEREELLREAERVAHFGTWTWDLGSGRVTWSDELCRILGVEPGSVTPSVEAFFARVHPEDRARAQAMGEQAIRDGVLPLVDCRIVRPDGSIRHTTHSSSILFDAAGATRRMVGSVLDRSEHLAAEATLRSTLELLEEAQRFAQLGNWRFDPNTREIEWSSEFRRITGFSQDDAPSMELFLERVVPEDQPRFRDAYQRAMTKGEAGRLDCRVRRPGGELRHVRFEGFPFVGADGRVELRGTMLDVTDQVRMREELAHAQKTEAVGRLAAGIAHDFNNLLTVITANLELLEQRIGPAPELSDAHRALSSAVSLTRRLLAFGRKAQLMLKWVEPNELVRSTLALMQRLVGDEVRLETELMPDVLEVHVDPLEIERALVNLVVNARDAMPRGGEVRIRTSVSELEGARQVELSVEDEGHGIDEAERVHIFEPFYTTRATGSGLGLATVLGTAEQHGGTVRVTERPGGGSIFTIVLPVAQGPSAAEAETARSAATPQAGVLKFLVIDDEAMVADVTRRLLEARGHIVWVATQPDDVMHIWSEHRTEIDLVICDVVMRHVRGPQLIARISDGGPPPRVLFITGYSDEAVRLELSHPVCSKPFSSQGLWRAIEDVMGRPRLVDRVAKPR